MKLPILFSLTPAGEGAYADPVCHSRKRAKRGRLQEQLGRSGRGRIRAPACAAEFTRDAFPGSGSFNQGNVRSGGDRLPEEQWTYSLIDRPFEYVREELDLEAEGYLIQPTPELETPI